MDMACMDPSSHHHHHHHQEMMASKSLDNILVCAKPQSQGQQQEKKPRPTEEAPKCPRCDSTNTKFCYYNNYSLSQPRYFCKSCRRYWTKGGTLRNVPVGGGCRKNRRSSSLSRRTSPDHDQPHHLITTIPTSSISPSPSPSPSSSSLASPNSILFSPFDHQYHTLSTNDLTLAMARLHKQVDGSMGFDHHENHGNISLLGNPSGNSHFDLFGNSFLIEQPNNGLHRQLYYRLGGNNVNVSTNEDNNQQNQMGMQFDQHNNDQEMMSNPSSSSSTPSTIIKQEVGENKVLWGLPWKLTSGEDNNMNGSGGDNELDSIKETWNNGVIGSSWFNLLNSPII